MFLDWQCPACRAAERAYAPVFEEFSRQQPGAVHVEVRDYPLNRRCNPYVPVEMHSAACEAAAAVRLARPNGTADALIAWLFANQEQLTPAAVRSAAATVGHITDFDARLAGTLREVASDVALGHGVGVGGTPTCFINGVLARNDGGTTLFRPEEIRRAIAIELKK
jgi:protein-disulfide isomerase